MKSKIFTTVILLCLLMAGPIFAQTPCNVQPEKFEYSMTVTAVVEIDDFESVDKNDVVYAKINNECRGHATLTYHNEVERYFAYLTIFSDVAHNENIFFEIYDASANKTLEAPKPLLFHSGQNLGVISNPFTIANQEKIVIPDILLSNGTIPESSSQGTFIGTFSLEPPPSGQAPIQFLFESGEGDNDNASFSIEGSQLFLNASLNPEFKSTYSIRVEVYHPIQDFEGHVFTLNVSDKKDTSNSNTTQIPVIVYDTIRVQVPVFDTVHYRVAIYEIDEKTSISDFSTGSVGLNIYPNPAKNKIVLNATSIIEKLDIYNCAGKINTTLYPYSENLEILLTGYHPGIYLLKLHTAFGEINRKVVVAK